MSINVRWGVLDYQSFLLGFRFLTVYLDPFIHMDSHTGLLFVQEMSVLSFRTSKHKQPSVTNWVVVMRGEDNLNWSLG